MHEFVKMTEQLNDQHWEEIIEHMAKFMNTHSLDTDDKTNSLSNNDGDAETVTPNLHAVIDIDWCVNTLIYHVQVTYNIQQSFYSMPLCVQHLQQC